MCVPFKHKWKIIHIEASDVYERPRPALPVASYKVYVLQCVKCGWIRGKKITT